MRSSVSRRPSGLVAALDPIMRVSKGVWIAHGSGDADRQTVDDFDRVQVRLRARTATRCAVYGFPRSRKSGLLKFDFAESSSSCEPGQDGSTRAKPTESQRFSDSYKIRYCRVGEAVVSLRIDLAVSAVSSFVPV